ncbi:MAG: hypothetical protein NWE93_00540 [Candidatus Bathyarchaeota archaeon]|nr:hypothetical protein [Candidatus Bathyarchaeota archaeon]
MLAQSDVVQSVTEYLQRKGYEVSAEVGKNSVSVELAAVRDRDHFLIEAIWETGQPSDWDIIFAVGKLVKRMKMQGVWFHYALAMPKDYFRFLREFELAGVEALGLHLFLVESFYTLTELDHKETVELIKELKAGNVSKLNLWGINYY